MNNRVFRNNLGLKIELFNPTEESPAKVAFLLPPPSPLPLPLLLLLLIILFLLSLVFNHSHPKLCPIITRLECGTHPAWTWAAIKMGITTNSTLMVLYHTYI